MSRYTHKMLESDATDLNRKLEKIGSEYIFVVGARNGYSAVDLATPKQAAEHCCQDMLVGGTPRECLAACHEYIAVRV